MFLASAPCSAGIFGVPTILAANGTRTATSVDPPGYLIVMGISSVNNNGDTTHQMRFFIEATGTTLDMKVFDPGNNGALDSVGGTATLTTYELFRPDGTSAGANYRIQNVGADNATTDNRLARLSFGGAFTAADAGNAFGTGVPAGNAALAPGLWELRITATNVAGDNWNALGLDIRDAAGNHYNVYTLGGDDDVGVGTAPTATDSSLSVGQLETAGGVPPATITERLIFYPYVNRGCSVQTSNYDSDVVARPLTTAQLTDQAEPTPVLTTLTASNNGVQSTNTVTVEATAAPNQESLNYGLWTLTNNTGSGNGNNEIDWRLADYIGWADAPAGLPRDPNGPLLANGMPFGAIRMYLPNGYTGVAIPPNSNATAPLEPTLKTSMRVVSGPNPPANPGVTRFTITATVTNPTTSALSNVVITTPLASNVVYIAGTGAGFIDGVQPGTLCADADASNISIAGVARRCAIGTVAAGSTATLNIDVNFSPPAAPALQNLTGPPPAVVVGTNAITLLTRQAVGSARAEFAANPNYVVGQYVTIAGATNNGYNGLARVTGLLAGGVGGCTAARFCITYAIPTGIAAGNDGGLVKTATTNAADPECPYTANGPVCAQYTTAFSSATWPRAESLGPVCNLVSSVAAGAALLTRASIRGVRVTGSAVEFVTGGQRGTVAFNVYALSKTGAPVRVGGVTAAVADSQQPVFYRVETGLLTSERLLIEEVDRSGRRHVMGPFAAGDQRLRAGFERLEARLAQEGPVEMRGHARRARVLGRGVKARSRPDDAEKRAVRPRRAQGGVKIETSGPGFVTVTLAELRANGLPPNVPSSKLVLTNQGRLVEVERLPGAIGFTAEPLSTDYTGRNVYVVTWGKHAPDMRASLTRSEDPLDPAFVRAERNTIYLASGSPTGDPWFWDLLYGDGSAWPYPGSDGAFDLPGLLPASGEVPVRIRVFAWSSGAHTLDAWINGARVSGDLEFEGAGYRTLEGTLDGAVLRAASNELGLSYRASDDDQGLYFDYVELGVSADTGSGQVARIAPFELEPPGEGARKAEYLIVTHPLFREQAERLASLKRRDGLKPAIVDVEDAYDGYSAGIVEPNAIKALIQDAFSGGRLRYVLLLGGDTFDTHDYLGTGARSLVPSLLSWDGEFGRVPSENLYADVDGDGAPDVAIGRLPASTLAEAQALVDKVERQTASLLSSAGRHVVAVDNQAPGDISFLALAQRAVRELPPGSSVVLSDLSRGADAARETLLGGLRQGALATHYFGHGAVQAWADESLLDVDDVASLAGTPETLLFAWSCDSQWYLSIEGDSLGEALLLLPRGGAVASFGPSGITDVALQPLLFEPLYRHLFRKGLTLGQAIRQAKRDALLASPRGDVLANGWNLLGDPALRLR